MSGDRFFWEPTDYPRECPECGEGTCFKPPEVGWGFRPIWMGMWLVFPLVVGGLVGTADPARLAILAAFAVGLLALFCAYRACAGPRFSRKGFVLCGKCRWLRSGVDEGSRLCRLRERGERLFRGMALGLVPAVLFFVLEWGFGRSGADSLLVPLCWMLFISFSAWQSFRPRRFPPEPKARR